MESSILENADGSFSAICSGSCGALLTAIGMIICSELGDKTFVIAALLSMKSRSHLKSTEGKNERANENITSIKSILSVFYGCAAALILMTCLATVGGSLLPIILSKSTRTWLTISLFFVFGLKMLHEAYSYEPEDEESDLLHEKGGISFLDKCSFMQRWIAPITLQAFSLTVLAEWGDRSQMATFALAAEQGVIPVCVGAIIGHMMCTGLAVVGGKVLAEKISERVVLAVGGVCFLLFSVFTTCYEMSGGNMN